MLSKRLGIFSLVGAMLAVNLSMVSAAADEGEALPFILRNEAFAFEERVAAVIIDAGEAVNDVSLSAEDFDVHVVSTRMVDPEVVVYDGPREVTDVYLSEVEDWGFPSDEGQYIVLDFAHVGWGDGGTTIDAGYYLEAQYTVTYNGDPIATVDGSDLAPTAFEQTGVVSPVLDQYQYATSPEGMDYAYFLNDEIDEPLPLVVYFHGGGQGGDNYNPARFSNGGTIWATPEKQADFPAHVLVPRTPGNQTDVAAVKGVIDGWIAEGKVDANRIYMTGYSMGSSSTWAFVSAYPDYVAASVYGAGTGPSNAELIDAVDHMPLWEWVDEDDFALGGVLDRYEEWGEYLLDYKLTNLPEVVLNDYPYNGWTFDGHSSWLVAYNEYVDEERGTVFDWLFGISKIRGIEDVEVDTVAGVTPALPATVTVDVHYNADGVVPEQRAVVWDAIDPAAYGDDASGVFTVEGTVDGVVEKAVATVNVEPKVPVDEPKDPVVDVYSTPGFHNVNDRRWYTECEPYSQTIRCTTNIWATQVTLVDGRFVGTTGWHFNNLTYLPFMTRAQWSANPLGHAGSWTSTEGREWKTECDTTETGRNGCRSFIWTDIVSSTQGTDGVWTHQKTQDWVFNNIVRFKS